MFYTYYQNNSYGEFVHEDGRLAEYVIIEAQTEEHANQRAVELGIYFDGVSAGRDCSCCGDRWSRPYEGGTQEPLIFGTTPAAERPYRAKPYPYCYVHYTDGRVESHTYNPEH